MSTGFYDTQYQSRTILSALGVVLWAARTSQTQLLAQPSADVSSQPLARTAVSTQVSPSKADITAPTNKPSKAPIGSQLTHLSQALKEHSRQAQHHTVQELSSTTQSTTSTELDTVPTFRLQAIVYRQWVLLVDFDGIDIAKKDIWVSLNQAIQNHAKASQLTYEQRVLNYPIISNDPNANQPAVIDASIKGFIFGCLQASPKIEQILVLSVLPPCINLKNIISALDDKLVINQDFGLDKMWKQPTAKKQFWQYLHQADDKTGK